MLVVQSFTFNPFSENTYIVHNSATGEGLILDPGCYTLEDRKEMSSYILAQNISIQYVVNTHCHIDHVYGNRWCCDYYQCQLSAPEGELANLQSAQRVAAMYGVMAPDPSDIGLFIKGGDVLSLGGIDLQVLDLPGHSQAHIGMYSPEFHVLLGGDVLFLESIGRTDLPGGDFPTLERSIKNYVYTLPEQTKVFSGHGPSTTVGHEKMHNPFVRA